MLPELESLLRAAGFEAQRIPASEAAPIEQLVVLLPPDTKGRERNLWVTPLPHLEADLEPGLSLLQLLAPLPFQLTIQMESQLDRTILQLNNDLAIGGFGLRDGVIFYREVLMLGPDQTTNGRIVVETIGLMNFLLDQFSSAIEDAQGTG